MKKALVIFLALIISFLVLLAILYFKYMDVKPIELTKGASKKENLVAIDAWFQDLQEDNKFNGAILMMKDGEVNLAKTYGYKNCEKEELSEGDAFRLASISKQFTAACILILHDRGLLGLDTKVVNYIEEFPYKEVTVRHLLNNISGVPNNYMILADKYKEEYEVLSIKLAVEFIVRENQSTDIQPNEVYEYSNTNYIILAHLVELVTGSSFENFIREELFIPLEMNDSRVWNLLSDENNLSNRVQDLEIVGESCNTLMPDYIDGVAGDGAVFCSLRDMIKWESFWYENKLIKPETLKQAFEKPTLNNGKKSDYGFGWLLTSSGQLHDGAWMGTNAFLVRNPTNRSFSFIIDNSASLTFDIILGELGKIK